MEGARGNSIFESLIQPAILRLLAETEGEYRCERDLHHHLTVCFQQITPLQLGTRQKQVRMEEPGVACYGSGRKGNLDYFFLGAEGYGAAVELNFNYDSTGKIIKDVQKLIDPKNGYAEAVYFAFGRKKGFGNAVKLGLERAYSYFAEDVPDFRLNAGFRVLIAEHSHRGVQQVLLGSTASPCRPADLTWCAIALDHQKIVDTAFVTEKVPIARVGNVKSELGSRECKAWLHWPAPHSSGYFLAFVNQKGSCSMRRFDADTGNLTGKPEIGKGRDFEEHFSDYWHSGRRLRLQRQPNLETQCSPKLPTDVLAALQKQISSDTG